MWLRMKLGLTQWALKRDLKGRVTLAGQFRRGRSWKGSTSGPWGFSVGTGDAGKSELMPQDPVRGQASRSWEAGAWDRIFRDGERGSPHSLCRPSCESVRGDRTHSCSLVLSTQGLAVAQMVHFSP